MALGIFSTKTARTINANAEERLYYSTGAEIVLAEKWNDNSGAMTLDESLTFSYEEPNFEKYEKMEEIESVTKVLVDENLVTSVPSIELTLLKASAIIYLSLFDFITFAVM